MKWLKILFWIEAAVQLILGGLMLITPSIMQKLIYVVVPNIFIQTIGSVALSLALLAILAAINAKEVKLALSAAATLAVFNFGLAILLSIAAYEGLISWLGLIVHLPFAIIFTYATIKLRTATK